MRIVRNLGAALLSLLLILTTGASAVAVPTSVPLRVLIMGTSTTACVGPTDPAACYVQRIRDARPGVPVTVIGRAGTYLGYGTVEQNWTQQVIPTGHSIVVIQHGLNDWYVPRPTEAMRLDVLDFLARTRAANPLALIVWVRTWMPVVTPANWTARKAVWDAHAAVTRDAVWSYGGVWLDLDPTGTAGDSACAVYGDTCRDGSGTGWHYGNTGNRVLAEQLLRYIPKSARPGPVRR